MSLKKSRNLVLKRTLDVVESGEPGALAHRGLGPDGVGVLQQRCRGVPARPVVVALAPKP